MDPGSESSFLRRSLNSSRRYIRGQTLPFGKVCLKRPKEARRTHRHSMDFDMRLSGVCDLGKIPDVSLTSVSSFLKLV